MAYRHLGKETGTEPVKCKINEHHVRYIDAHDLVFNAVVNYALRSLIHDLQAGQLKPTWQMHQGSRASRWHGDKNIIKAARVRRDLLDYLRLNTYNINGTINLSLSRQISEWEGNENKTGFTYPVGVTRAKDEPRRYEPSTKNVGTKHSSALQPVEEPTQPEAPQGDETMQNKTVRYLGDPCKHAKWIDGLTHDMCGHCEYYDQTITDNPESHCMYHGKR